MKIVFMGTPAFAVPTLQALVDAGHEIQAVVTQPDRRGNRGKVVPSPVKAWAVENGLKVMQPERIRGNEEFISTIEDMQPEMIVVAAFGQILPESVLNIPEYGCINVHGSLLPQLRGAAPMQRAIADGLDETGVTIMKMAKGLDTGDMISRVVCDIRGKDITEVSELLSREGARLLVYTIPSIADGTADYVAQDDSLSSYAKPIMKSDGLVDWNDSAASIERRIRAYREWPVVHTYIDGKQVKIYDAEVVDRQSAAAPGSVVEIDRNSFTVACGEGELRIRELQLQGKKRMQAGDFLRGYRLDADSVFCREV